MITQILITDYTDFLLQITQINIKINLIKTILICVIFSLICVIKFLCIRITQIFYHRLHWFFITDYTDFIRLHRL